MSLTCASGCHQRDRHLAECPCADPQHEHGKPRPLTDAEAAALPDWEICAGCPGCLPRLAVPGLAVCPGCERAARDGLAELPDLWVDLAERPRLAGVSKAPTSEGDTPDPMSDPRRQERSAIKAMLVSWCLTLADDHRIGVPNEAGIAAVTRRLAAWHSDQARQNRDAALLLAMPTIGPLVRDPEGAAVLKLEEARHARAAQAARDDRETGRDILRAICEHITRHVGRLLAGEHAEQLVSDVKAATRGARGRAYVARPSAVRVSCTCGGNAPASLDGVTCPDCGATIAPPIDTDADGAPSTAVDLAGWLLVAHGLDIGPAGHARILKWAQRYPTEIKRAGSDDRRRALYERAGVLDVARRLIARREHAA